MCIVYFVLDCSHEMMFAFILLHRMSAYLGCVEGLFLLFCFCYHNVINTNVLVYRMEYSY